MKCPKCGGEQHCPCENCKDRNAGSVVWVWLPDGERIACGHCGFTAHADWWHDEEGRQILRATNSRSGSL